MSRRTWIQLKLLVSYHDLKLTLSTLGIKVCKIKFNGTRILKEHVLTGAELGIPGGADDTTGGGGTVTTETENHTA